MTKKKKIPAAAPEAVSETRLELLEKELNALTAENVTLKEENLTLREKARVLGEKMKAATKGASKATPSNSTIHLAGEDRYEFKYPAFNYHGQKLLAADIVKDPDLLAIFVDAGNARKL